jgi:peptidoglycan/xylan/chitin deacetylase (PgdA/CDA1 family)
MRVITLEYHDVIADADFGASGFTSPSADSYKIAAADFDAHMQALVGKPNAIGADVRALMDAPGGAPPVLITFDDGGVSALEVTAELLERRGWVGHFFVTTAWIGAPGFVDRNAIAELARRGHVIGSHSHSHPVRMARLTPTEMDEEWRTSTVLLAEALGHPVEVASVPGGLYSPIVARAAAAAGIRWLFTSEPTTRVTRVDGCTVLGRYTIRRTTTAQQAASLVARFSPARGAQWVTWNTKKVAKAVAGETYLRVRASILGDSRGSHRV